MHHVSEAEQFPEFSSVDASMLTFFRTFGTHYACLGVYGLGV